REQVFAKHLKNWLRVRVGNVSPTSRLCRFVEARPTLLGRRSLRRSSHQKAEGEDRHEQNRGGHVLHAERERDCDQIPFNAEAASPPSRNAQGFSACSASSAFKRRKGRGLHRRRTPSPGRVRSRVAR